MKTRIGFVSNSSSSSFILARNGVLKLEDVLPVIVRSDVTDLLDYTDISDWGDEDSSQLEGLEEEKLLDKACEIIAKSLLYELNGAKDMTIGDWKLTAREFSNEDSYLYECYMYSASDIDTDKIKIAQGNY